MVNKERLMELLGEGYYINKNGHVCVKDCHAVHEREFVLWSDYGLSLVETKIQLIGYLGTGLPLPYYDEIYEKLDDSIFEVDKEKVKTNLERLGLLGCIDDDGDYLVNCVGVIRKENLSCVEQLKSIPQKETGYCGSGEEVYNNILKASKEWGK